MRLRAEDQAVEVVAQRHRFLPDLFRWHGRYYEVEAVERCWTSVGRRKAARHFRVQCLAGTFELSQDLSSGAWRLRRAILRPGLAGVVREGRLRCPRQLQAPRSPRGWGLLLPVVMAVYRVSRARGAGGGKGDGHRIALVR